MDRRRAGALLALAACVACSAAAPTASNQTALDLYDGAPEGCYYNFQHYGEGDRIMTNEPCLNCTCHNRMLMCYLRVCPFTKPIGQDCTVEKRADQCCPIVTCPDVPVDLLTSTSTSSPAEYGATGLGKLDKYGCSISGKYFPEGSKVPPTPNKPCEHCYCIRNMTTCVMQECTLHVDGCTPIYHKDVCCPVRYSCDHPEDEMPLLDDMSTTVRPTPGFLLTTTTISPVTQMTQDCVHDDQVFADGALIKTQKACEHCYCMKGDIVCVVQECGAPMENEGKNCTSLPPREGQCCPDTYICEGDEYSSEITTEPTTDMILDKITTLVPPRRSGDEGSGYRNEPDKIPDAEAPALPTEQEGSGEEPILLKPSEKLPEDVEKVSEIGVSQATSENDQDILRTTISPSQEPTDTSDIDEEDNVLPLTPVEPQDFISITTNIPDEKEDDTTEDYLVISEKDGEITHQHHVTSKPTSQSYSEISTELNEEFNTIANEKLPESHEHASSTVEPMIEEENTTELIINKEIEKEKTHTSSIDISHTTEKMNEIDSITETTLSNVEQSTVSSLSFEDIEKVTPAEDKTEDDQTLIHTDEHSESDQPEPHVFGTEVSPIKESEKATTEPDHSQNTVDVAEDDTTKTHMQITTMKYSDETDENSTSQNEMGSGEESIPVADSFEPHKDSTTVVPSEEGGDGSTVEPDKGLNTISSEINSDDHKETLSTDKPVESEVSPDVFDDTASTGYEPSVELSTKADQHGVTTEPSFRKEDEISASTDKPKETESSTSQADFTDEEFIPTISQGGELIHGTTSQPTEDKTTTSQSDLSTDDQEPWSKPVTDHSVLTETKPEKDSELLKPELYSTEKVPEITTLISEPISHEEPGRIPGEGDCLLSGVTYRNNSGVPSNNKCHSGCKCVSSIIKCDPIICSPPPDYMDNCQSIYDTPDSCCPTYICDHLRETVPPQSDNQMTGTESPVPSPTIECRGDQCEIITETKEPMEPEKSHCSTEGCDDTLRQQIDSQGPTKNIGECSDDKCGEHPAVCTNGKCETKETQNQPCDKENGCETASVKPCEGENCQGKDKISEPIMPMLCENGKDCKGTQTPQVPCEGESCKSDCGDNGCDTNVDSSPQDLHKEICDDEHGCAPQKPEIPECDEDSCKKIDALPVENKLPTKCEGSHCTDETVSGTPEDIDNLTDIHTESYEQETNIPDVTEKSQVQEQDKKTQTPYEDQTQKEGEKTDSSGDMDESITKPTTVVSEKTEEIYPVHDGSHTEIPEIYDADKQQTTNAFGVITEKQDEAFQGSTESTVIDLEKDIKTEIPQQQTSSDEYASDKFSTVSYDKETIETSTLLQDITPSKSTDISSTDHIGIDVFESEDNKPLHPIEDGVQTIQPTTEHDFVTKEDEENEVISLSHEKPSSYHPSTTISEEIKPIETDYEITTQTASSETSMYDSHTSIENEMITKDDASTESEQAATKTPELSIVTENTKEITESIATTKQDGVHSDITESTGTKTQVTESVFSELQEGKLTTTAPEAITTSPEYVTEEDTLISNIPVTEGVDIITDAKPALHEMPVYVPEHDLEKELTKIPDTDHIATEIPMSSATKPEKSITDNEEQFITGEVDITTATPTKHFDQSTERYEPYTVQILDDTPTKSSAVELRPTVSSSDDFTKQHELDKEVTRIPAVNSSYQQDVDAEEPQTEAAVTEKQGTDAPMKEIFDLEDLEKPVDKTVDDKEDGNRVITEKAIIDTETVEISTKVPDSIITEISTEKSDFASESLELDKETEGYKPSVTEIHSELTESPLIITTESDESLYITMADLPDQQEKITKSPDSEKEQKIHSNVHDAESFITDEPEIDTEEPEVHITVPQTTEKQLTKLEPTDVVTISTPVANVEISHEENTQKPESLYTEDFTVSEGQKPGIQTESPTSQDLGSQITDHQDDLMSHTPKLPTTIDTKESLHPEVTKDEESVTDIPKGVDVPVIISQEGTVTQSPETTKNSESEVTEYETITKTPEKTESDTPIFGQPATEISDDEHKHEVTKPEYITTMAPVTFETGDNTATFEIHQTTVQDLLREPTVKVTGQEEVTSAPDFTLSQAAMTEHAESVAEAETPETVEQSETEVTKHEETVTKAPIDTKLNESQEPQEEVIMTQDPEGSKIPVTETAEENELATTRPEVVEYTKFSDYPKETHIMEQDELATKTPVKYDESETYKPSQDELVTNIPEITLEPVTEAITEDLKSPSGEVTKPNSVIRVPVYTDTTEEDKPEIAVPQDTEMTGQTEPEGKPIEDTKIVEEDELVTKTPQSTDSNIVNEETVTKTPDISSQEDIVTKIPGDDNLSEKDVTGTIETMTSAPETTIKPQFVVTDTDDTTMHNLENTETTEEHKTKHEKETTKNPDDSMLLEKETTKLQEPVTEISDYTKLPELDGDGQKQIVPKLPETTIVAIAEDLTKSPEITENLTEKVTERGETVTEALEDTSKAVSDMSILGAQTTIIPEYTKAYETPGLEETVTKSPEKTIGSESLVTDHIPVSKTPDDIRQSEYIPEEETIKPEMVSTGLLDVTTQTPEKTKVPEETIIEQGDNITPTTVETKEPEKLNGDLEETATKTPETPNVQDTDNLTENMKEPEVTSYLDMVTQAPEKEDEIILTGSEDLITKSPDETISPEMADHKEEGTLTEAPEKLKDPEIDITIQQDTITEGPVETHEPEAVTSGPEDVITEAPEANIPEVIVTKEDELITRMTEPTMKPGAAVTDIITTEAPVDVNEPEIDVTVKQNTMTESPETTHELDMDTKTETPEKPQPESIETVHEYNTTLSPKETELPVVLNKEKEDIPHKTPDEDNESDVDDSHRKDDTTTPSMSIASGDVTEQGEIVTNIPDYSKPHVTSHQEDEVTKAPEDVRDPEVAGHEEIRTESPKDDLPVTVTDTSVKEDILPQEEPTTNAAQDVKENELDTTQTQEEITKSPDAMVEPEATHSPDTKETEQEATVTPADVRPEETEVTTHGDMITKSPEHVKESHVTEDEGIATKLPELVEKLDTTTYAEKVTEIPEESEPEITSDIETVTKLPADVVKPVTHVTDLVASDIVTKKPVHSDDDETQKTTTEPTVVTLSETTPELIILEEHTHKTLEEASTTSPSGEELSTVLAEGEQQMPVSGVHVETGTKETEITPTIDAETSTVSATNVSGTTDKVSDSAVPIQEISTEDLLNKELTTTAPVTATLSDSEKKPVSETDVVAQTEKIPPGSEIPPRPETSYDTSTTKATTDKQPEPVPDDQFTKPEQKPSEILPTSESPKPIAAEPQPSDELPGAEEDGHFPPSGMGGYGETDYGEDEQPFGPGTCRYGGKVYVSAQQIPRDDPCDFCFCFRSDIICLQQSCPPPIHGCHEEPIQGFCCPRYECPVSMATTVNVTTTTTTTTTTLPPHFPTHSYKGAAQKRGCQIKGHTYKVGEVVRSASGPCLHCTCGGDGQMKCDPKACTPEPMLRQMIAAAVSAKRRR